MENFEEILRKDLHQFLQSMQEVDEHLPECPDVEDKWEDKVCEMIFEKYEEDNKPLA